jgi:ribosome recycling factor
MVKDVLEEAKKGMDKSVEALKVDLAALRTGRASTGLVNKLLVEYYGTQTALQELALVSIPEPQLIAIRPYDPGALKAIERAILQSDLGMTPNNDGKLIRLQVPTLTEERRRNLVKTVHKRVEEARVSVRNTRRDNLEDLREFEKEKLISEDELHGGQDDLQKLTDNYIKTINDIGAAKEKEILEV